MARLLTIVLAVFFVGTSFSQQINEVKCTMTVEEVLREQPFDIDHYKSEDARYITIDLFDELEAVYEKVNNGLTGTANLEEHFTAIDSLLNSANGLDMNYSMFDEDLDFVESLK